MTFNYSNLKDIFFSIKIGRKERYFPSEELVDILFQKNKKNPHYQKV